MNPILSQADVNISLLCMLYEKAEGRNHFEPPEIMAAKFHPPIGVDRIRLGLESLVEKRYATKHNEEYGITEIGISFVESEYSIALDGANYQYRKRKRGQSIDDGSREMINWTKWGTVIGAIALIVAILTMVLQ